MKKVTLLALMLLLSTVTFPQPPETDQAIKAEVQKLGSIGRLEGRRLDDGTRRAETFFYANGSDQL